MFGKNTGNPYKTVHTNEDAVAVNDTDGNNHGIHHHYEEATRVEGLGSTDIELTAVAVATTASSGLEHSTILLEDGPHSSSPSDDSYDDERLVWTDTHFDNLRQEQIHAVFDHYPPRYVNEVVWQSTYGTLRICAAGGVCIGFLVAVNAPQPVVLGDWSIFFISLFLLIVVNQCNDKKMLERWFPARIISHTALTYSGIRHELVPEAYATDMKRPCVIKIPYSDIASISFEPSATNDKPELNMVKVVTKSIDDETKYIGSGIPLQNRTFNTTGLVSNSNRKVVLNLHGLMEPYAFKRMATSCLRVVDEESSRGVLNRIICSVSGR